MGIESIVNVQISVTKAKATAAGYGIPLILSHTAAWAERVRTYKTAAAVLVDFAATSPEYLAAAAIFNQDPRPTTLKIGRSGTKPTQVWTVTPVASNLAVYTVTIFDTAGVSHAVSYTADATATIAEITAGLKVLIDALALAVTVVADAAKLTITANVAGVFFGVYVGDIALLGIAQTHADPSTAADLRDIALEDNNWFALVTLFNSDALVLAAAGWCETNSKLYGAALATSIIATTTKAADVLLGVSGSAAAQMQTAARYWTFAVYAPRAHEFTDAALFGARLTKAPGSETWKFASPAGPTPASLTDAQAANVAAKNCNAIVTITDGVAILTEGKVASGEWIDVVRFKAWLESYLGTLVLNLFLGVDKVPFTDPGIALVKAKILAGLKKGVDVGGLSADPKPEVLVPLAADISDADKAARNLTGITFSAVLAGAIHAVDPLNGTLTT